MGTAQTNERKWFCTQYVIKLSQATVDAKSLQESKKPKVASMEEKITLRTTKYKGSTSDFGVS